MIQAGYSRTHVSPQPTRVTPYYLNPPQFAQGHNSLADFDFDVTDESYFEPRILESYSVNHHTSNQSIDLQPSSFTDSHAIDICFGSIPDVRTRIRTAFLQPPNYEHIVSLAISPIASFYGVAYSGTVFATISKTNCAVIKQLYGYQRIQVRAFVPYNVLINALSSHSEKSPATLKLDINIYGARDDAHSVGKTLSSGGLILQQPTHGLERVKYYNPHFLHISSTFEKAHSEEQNRGKSTVDAAERDTEITTIFNGLAHTEQLQKRAAGRGVKTILRDHQMEAIDFILRRESMPLAPELNMWDEHETDAGDIVYQHAITGTRRAEPLQALGGILADEMGLGKTIVILAVIASTLDEASAYKMEQAVSFDATYQKQRSKATLVIAPSSFYQKNRTPSMTNYISHDIRNRNTRQFEVAASLATQHRWCLTGTPIQNSLEDLGALIAFLRVPLLEKPQTFQRFIVDQSKQGVNYRFQNLRTLLESVCLRRTKEIIGLADPVQETRELTFTTVERDQYNELLRKYEALVGMEQIDEA
ncbi:P-loop containing nucleoside triphosphate hydrolase, partial [Apiospora saccharicola]